jgi:hypothetical protein
VIVVMTLIIITITIPNVEKETERKSPERRR